MGEARTDGLLMEDRIGVSALRLRRHIGQHLCRVAPQKGMQANARTRKHPLHKIIRKHPAGCSVISSVEPEIVCVGCGANASAGCLLPPRRQVETAFRVFDPSQAIISESFPIDTGLVRVSGKANSVRDVDIPFHLPQISI